MSEEKTYTELEAHRFFAVRFHGKAWELLEKPDRTKQEDELMIHTAHASCCHWLTAGTGVHHQRGEWLIALVYSVLGIAEAALRYANRCLELTRQHADLMEDFDWAFAYECVARANAIAGKRDEAIKHIERAQKAGEAIKEAEDRKVFLAEFNGGNWNNLR
jgi:tetratricopeptide (TPR) repeat protein